MLELQVRLGGQALVTGRVTAGVADSSPGETADAGGSAVSVGGTVARVSVGVAGAAGVAAGAARVAGVGCRDILLPIEVELSELIR